MNPESQDSDLLARAKTQDPAALRECCLHYGQPLYGFLCGVLGQTAEKKYSLLTDAVTEALQRFDPEKASPPFLLAGLKSLIDRIRRENPESLSITPLATTDLRLRWLLESLAHLPWRGRALLLMRYQLDLLFDEMSFVFSVSPEKIRSEFEQSSSQLDQALADAMKGRYDRLPRH